VVHAKKKLGNQLIKKKLAEDNPHVVFCYMDADVYIEKLSIYG
jgi:hypothetical protein